MKLTELRGKDSADFLHRVTAGTVKGLEAGQGRPGLLLTGQSKMIAQFELLKVAGDHFLLASPEACTQGLRSGLEALHFSESLEILPLERALGIRECSGASRKEGEAFPFFQNGGELTWNSAVPGFGFATGTEGIPEAFHFGRIAALYPWTSDWTEATPALEAGTLPMIDRFKGCYPGQEVVELSLNVGHPVRVLIAVESAAPIGELLDWNGAQVPVTSRAEREGTHRALARVPWNKKDFLPAGFTRLKSHW
jgi:folate-binding Fe-S cluster repair protein YgfZ